MYKVIHFKVGGGYNKNNLNKDCQTFVSPLLQNNNMNILHFIYFNLITTVQGEMQCSPPNKEIQLKGRSHPSSLSPKPQPHYNKKWFFLTHGNNRLPQHKDKFLIQNIVQNKTTIFHHITKQKGTLRLHQESQRSKKLWGILVMPPKGEMGITTREQTTKMYMLSNP